MPRYAILLALPLSCASFGSPLSDAAQNRILLPASVMERLAASSPRKTPFADQAPFWDPSTSEIEACESKLRARWGGRQYDLQYFGTTDDGKRVLRVHGWSAGRFSEGELASFPIMTMDAGRCHFTAYCNSNAWPEASLSFSTRGPSR